MSLPEEEEVDHAPEWLEGHSFLVQNIHCQMWQICGWHESYVDNDMREEAVAILRAEFQDHWREHHG